MMAKTLLDEEDEDMNFYGMKLFEENKVDYCFTNEKTLFSIARSELMQFMEAMIQEELLNNQGELVPD